MKQSLHLHRTLHDFTQSWLNGADFSLRGILGQKRDYLKEHILALNISGLNTSLNGGQLLPLAYRKVLDALKKCPKKRIEILASDLLRTSLDESKHAIAFLRPLFELRDYVQKHFTRKEIFGFFVHGSLSTMDYIENYSDFDTLVIIRKEVINDPEWLIDFGRRLAKSNTFLYLLDPLQHHPHFVITEYDMEAYAEPFFPLELFKYTTELSDIGDSIIFHVRDASVELEYVFRFWMKYFHNPNKCGYRNKSLFSVKQFIQSIALLPAIYLQLKTKWYTYKKYTHDLAKLDFSTETWNIVEKTSMVRQLCPFKSYYPYWLRKIIGLYGHPKLLAYLHRKIDRNNTQQILNILGPDMLKDALELIKEMQERLGL